MTIGENIVNNLKLLCEKKGLNYNLVLRENSAKSWINNMNYRGTMPSIDKIIALADYLDVSIDYLIGRTDVPEININKNNNQVKEITIKISGGIVQIDGIEQVFDK